uniref:Uncharacterized protein n=1 Tax=Leersia perrieri TaxID=77586 RepID=A0A0D9X5W6_9ORYZ
MKLAWVLSVRVSHANSTAGFSRNLTKPTFIFTIAWEKATKRNACANFARRSNDCRTIYQ